MQTLSGRTAVFAGATAGDGRAAATALCAGGMNVVLMTHNVPQAETLAAEIEAAGCPGRCVYFTDSGRDLAAAYKKAAETFGGIDVVISNIGDNGEIDDIETLPPENLTKSFEHLAVGAFRSIQAALPYLKKSAAPRIILMTTVEGVSGGTYESFSNAVAKGAVASLTVNAAARLARYGITVNCVSKGAIPRVEGVRPGTPDPADRLDSIPLGRLGTAEDMAGIICFYASEESGYITGQTTQLSGGLNLGR